MTTPYRPARVLTATFNNQPIRIAISLVCLAAVVYHLPIGSNFQLPTALVMFTAISFSFINLGLELFKWHLSASRMGETDPLQNTSAALAGYALGLITPNRTGDYFGRMMFYPKRGPVRMALASIPGNFTQLCATVLAGIPALYFLGSPLIFEYLNNPKSIDFSLFLILLMVFSIGFWIIPKIGRRQKVLFRIMRPLLQPGFMWLISLLSLLRYSIFCFQFAALYYMMGGHCEIQTLAAGIMLVYLIKSFLPLVAFGELGVREGIVFGVFSLLGADTYLAVSASLLMWIFNLLMPSLAGAVILLLRNSPKQ